MATISGDNTSGNDEEHLQTRERIHAALIKRSLDESLPTAEDVDGTAAKETALVSINQSVISRLVEIIKNDATVDLWPHLRELSREYKAERKAYVDEDQSPKAEEPATLAPDRHRHLLPTQGDITVAWPLAPRLLKLLQSGSSDTSSHCPDTQRNPISRSILLSLIQNGEWISQEFQNAVVRIAPEIVVKISKGDGTLELSNLQHIHRCSNTIPVPNPLGMLVVAQRFYTFTSFVEGTPLDRLWTSLTIHEKTNLRQQLNAIFTELRNLPLPSKDGFLGGGEPPVCQDQRRWTRTSSTPIRTEAQFNDFLLSDAYASSRLVNLVRSCLRQDHRIVMTHGDLHTRNILVNNSSDLTITGIVDWDTAGGYPEYWEYIKAVSISFIEEENDWDVFLPTRAIGMFADEYVKDCMIDRLVN